jgi:glutamyl/glutaminyl-tRNA synthetase
VQSQRLPVYHHHVDHLIANDKAYRCFCSPDELDAIRVVASQHGAEYIHIVFILSPMIVQA